jgi:isocitrate dehydrogenase (NAD+)
MGANKANPAAMILSSTMLLRHLGLESQANVIASSVYDVIKEGKIRTADMGGELSLGLVFLRRRRLIDR